MTVPTRFRGSGTLFVKGAQETQVEYEITLFEVDTQTRAVGWIEAGPAVLTYAQTASGAQLRLNDGRMVDVSIGRFTVKGSPSRVELIVHAGGL